MRSVLAVSGGMLVAFVLVLLIVFGILAPVLSWLFQIQPSASAVRTFAPILLFVCGLSFYFGGMAAAGAGVGGCNRGREKSGGQQDRPDTVYAGERGLAD